MVSKKLLKYFLLISLFMGAAFVFSEEKTAKSRKEEVLQLWNSNQKKQAEVLLKKWMSEDKKTPQPLEVAAQFKFEQGRYSKCLSITETAIDKFPKAGDAYYWRGRAYEALKRPLEAANELRAALLAQTTMTDTQAVLDRVQGQLGTPVADVTLSLEGSTKK